MGVFNLFRNKKKEEKNNQPTSRFIDDEWLEITAANKEEAIERACTALNTQASHLEIIPLSKDGKKFRARKAVAESADPDKTEPPSEAPRYADENRRDYDDEQTEETSVRAESDGQREDSWDEVEEVEEVEEETELGKTCVELLTPIIQAVESNAKLELYETNKTIRLEIKSGESGLFIGKFGQTLDAIQHLAKKMLEHKYEHEKHVVVDAEDYRLRREEALEAKARKLAKKARQERRSVSIEPMNAMDRRIVHLALKGEPGIETKSVGEGQNRRVLIVPKRPGGGRNDRSGGGRGNGRSRSGGYESRGRGRGNDRQGNGRQEGRRGPSRLHDSYDVPAHSKSEVFGDNPEEYFENYNRFDDEK